MQAGLSLAQVLSHARVGVKGALARALMLMRSDFESGEPSKPFSVPSERS